MAYNSFNFHFILPKKRGRGYSLNGLSMIGVTSPARPVFVLGKPTQIALMRNLSLFWFRIPTAHTSACQAVFVLGQPGFEPGRVLRLDLSTPPFSGATSTLKARHVLHGLFLCQNYTAGISPLVCCQLTVRLLFRHCPKFKRTIVSHIG